MKHISQSNFQKDQLYPVIVRAVEELLKKNSGVSPLDVLLHTQRVTKQQVEDWRFGRIPYLERVVVGNLSKMNRLLRILDLHARSLGLTAVQRVPHKSGRGGKRIVLRFSKSGDTGLEAAYSRHYLTNAAAQTELARQAKQSEKAKRYAVQRDERSRLRALEDSD